MPELLVEFEVYCSCRNGLCGNTETKWDGKRKVHTLIVEPCRDCLEAAEQEGRRKQQKEGDS